MELNLNSNIKYYRKQRGLTQEQLAEAMGVSIGAVSKWESGQSNPEISLLAELADFFEISVDVLLGYDLKTHNMKDSAATIKRLNLEKNFDEGLKEAQKALQKYPNSFEVVYRSASLYSNFGLELSDKTMLVKAKELYEHAAKLIHQNTNPDISYEYIQNEIGLLYSAMGENEKALEHMRKYNICGVNNARIGQILSNLEKHDEALLVLSENLVDCIANLFLGTISMANCYANLKELEAALGISKWMQTLLEGLRTEDKGCYTDKLNTSLSVLNAAVCINTGNMEHAKNYLREARSFAQRFDNNPNFSCSSIKYYRGEEHSFYDDIGETAMEGIVRIINLTTDEKEKLLEMWEELGCGSL